MKLLLRFNSVSSLTKYLNEELSKLKAAKDALEKAVNANKYLEMISIDEGDVKIDRMDVNDIKPLLNEIDNKVNAIDNLLREINKLMSNNDYVGAVYLEYENGYPTRVIISQPVMVSV